MIFRLLISFLPGICLLAVSTIAYAEEGASESSSERRIDAVILVDTSGSTLETDPARLRDKCINDFLKLLDPKLDRFAIVPFSDSASVSIPLTSPTEDTLKRTAGTLASLRNEGFYTDFSLAIKEGAALLDGAKGDGAKKIIILITDGKLEPKIDAAVKASLGTPQPPTPEELLFKEELPLLRESKISLYTLGVGPRADFGLLSKMAKTTDGASFIAASADEISPALDALYEAASRAQVIVSEGAEFKIDSKLPEVTFYVGHKKGDVVSAVAPKNKKLSKEDSGKGVQWYGGEEFDLITIADPDIGTWRILGLSSDTSFVAALTNLRLSAEFPSQVTSGQNGRVTARLFDGEKPVVLSSISDVTEFIAEAIPTDKVSQPIAEIKLNDKGENGDITAKDGIFSGVVEIEEEGEYKLRVISRSPTFERNQLIPFKVKPRPISLTVLSTEAAEEFGIDVREAINELTPKAHHAEGEEEHSEVEVPEDVFIFELNSDAAQWKKPQLKLYATDEHHKKYILPFVRVKGGNPKFLANPHDLPETGVYELYASISGEGKNKVIERGDSKTVSFTLEHLPESAEKITKKKEEHAVASHSVSSGPSWAFILTLLGIVLPPISTASAAMMLYKFSHKIQKPSSSPNMFIPPIPQDIMDKQTAFEELLNQEEIDLNDSIFTPDQVSTVQPEQAPAPSGSQAAPAVDQQAAAAQPPTDSKPVEATPTPPATEQPAPAPDAQAKAPEQAPPQEAPAAEKKEEPKKEEVKAEEVKTEQAKPEEVKKEDPAGGNKA